MKQGLKDKTEPLAEAGAEDAGRRGRGRGSVGKEVVTEAARQLLREMHPSGLTRKAVAERAAVDPALVRYYFSDLRTLLGEVLRLLVEEYRGRFAKLEFDPNKPAESLQKRIRLLTTFLAEEPSFHELFIDMIVNGKDEWAKETRDSFTDAFSGSLRELIENGQRANIFRQDIDPRFLYLAMIGSSQFLSSSGPVFKRLFGEEKSPIDIADSYAAFLAGLFMNGVSRQGTISVSDEAVSTHGDGKPSKV